MVAINISNLCKSYKKYPSKWMRLFEWLMPKKYQFHDLKWVLTDISFKVGKGEALGILGVNGAGKSTLLKLITGTVIPTSGDIYLKGNVASLLELGIGFHPFFTGRQNVYIAAQLMGLSKNTIDKLLPEILKFSELGDYIDEPVRIYSSGMQMRLAFSVATVLRPDILIVDEALSVGDMYFQHKSFDRIRKYKDLGTTVLLVSHDKQAILGLCDSAILLHNGGIECAGKPQDVIDHYSALLVRNGGDISKIVNPGDGNVRTISGTGEALIKSASLIDVNGIIKDLFCVGEPVKLTVVVHILDIVDEMALGYLIKDRVGQSVYGTNTALKKNILHDLKKGEEYAYEFDFTLNIGPGSYSLSLGLHSGDNHLDKTYYFDERALMFSVTNDAYDQFIGLAWIDPKVKIKRTI
jgi:lipopolysaccharide transport system ATP-binding protein